MPMKFVYFNGKGRGEISRLVLAAAGEKFEDVRIEQSEWPALKEKTPAGSLPYLEVDGQTIPQSLTIARYLAKRFNLMGKSLMEEARVNAVLDCLLDFREAIFNNAFEKDEAKKAEATKKIKEQKVPSLMKYLTAAKKQNGKSDFMVGDSLTLADLAVFDFLESGFAFDGEGLSPEIKAVRTKVASLPRIKTWLDKRPKTQF